jgi:hypothetical protein
MTSINEKIDFVQFPSGPNTHNADLGIVVPRGPGGTSETMTCFITYLLEQVNNNDALALLYTNLQK